MSNSVVNGVLIRADGLVCTFQADSWLGFAHLALQQSEGLWAQGAKVVKVFGSQDGHLEEHKLSDLRDAIKNGTIGN